MQVVFDLEGAKDIAKIMFTYMHNNCMINQCLLQQEGFALDQNENKPGMSCLYYL